MNDDRPCLHLLIPGKPVSGNHEKIPNPLFFKEGRTRTKSGRRMPRFLPTRDAHSFDEKIKVLALMEARRAKWVVPEWVRVDIRIWNVNMDRENVMKPLHDPLQGIAFTNDKNILDGWVQRAWDDNGPRVELWIRAVDRSDYDVRKKPARRKPAGNVGDRVPPAVGGNPGARP